MNFVRKTDNTTLNLTQKIAEKEHEHYKSDRSRSDSKLETAMKDWMAARVFTKEDEHFQYNTIISQETLRQLLVVCFPQGSSEYIITDTHVTFNQLAMNCNEILLTQLNERIQ